MDIFDVISQRYPPTDLVGSNKKILQLLDVIIRQNKTSQLRFGQLIANACDNLYYVDNKKLYNALYDTYLKER